MFLEGRLWHLGSETGQMRREKLMRQADDRHRGQAGVFIHLGRAKWLLDSNTTEEEKCKDVVGRKELNFQSFFVSISFEQSETFLLKKRNTLFYFMFR